MLRAAWVSPDCWSRVLVAEACSARTPCRLHNAQQRGRHDDNAKCDAGFEKPSPSQRGLCVGRWWALVSFLLVGHGMAPLRGGDSKWCGGRVTVKCQENMLGFRKAAMRILVNHWFWQCPRDRKD